MSGGSYRPPIHRAEAIIDLGAYARNLAVIRARVAPAEVMAVVKADAYGHGLLPVARVAVADGVRWLGALDLSTALELRAADLGQVSIFAWLLGPREDYRPAIEARIDLGVSTVDQLDQIADAASRLPAQLHLKIDTGLHRNGATEAEWPGLVARALELERRGIAVLRGVWTHISEASEEEDSAAIARFTAAIAVAEGLGADRPLRHLAASAASFARSDARFDLVRVGAFGYGISPGDGITAGELGLVPVMTVTAPVFAVGDGIAELAIGAGDGISSVVAGRVEVAIGGVRYPVVGVGLDSLSVAVGDAGVSPADVAVLFGSGDSSEQTLQEWADAIGTIGEEIVTRLSSRIPRRYV